AANPRGAARSGVANPCFYLEREKLVRHWFIRSKAIGHAVRAAIEGLEGRVLLSGSPQTSLGSVATVDSATATVTGTVFNDLNGDAARETGEPSLAGRTVFADANRNGLLDPGEPSAISDSQGHYQITGIAPGQYSIEQVIPSGWQFTAPLNWPVTATYAAGQSYTVPDFGSVQLPAVNTALDSTFGNQGVAADGASIDRPDNLLLLPDGHLLATGSSGLYRFDSSGALDPSFGNGGFKAVPWVNTFLNGSAVQQPDDKILVSGMVWNGSYYDMAIGRFDPTTGAADPTFGSNGRAIAGFTADTEFESVALQSDGKIIVSGAQFNRTTSQYSIVLARFSSSGILDSTFGSSGLLQVSVPGANLQPTA